MLWHYSQIYSILYQNRKKTSRIQPVSVTNRLYESFSYRIGVGFVVARIANYRKSDRKSDVKVRKSDGKIESVFIEVYTRPMLYLSVAE